MRAKPPASAVGLLFVFLLTSSMLWSQDDIPVIRSVRIERRDVWDEREGDWFFGSSVMNALHVMTKDYVTDDEIFFDIGDDLDTVLLLETERVLRRTGAFTTVRVRHERVGDSADVIIETQDRWSLDPAIVLSTGGGISTLGGQIEEYN